MLLVGCFPISFHDYLLGKTSLNILLPANSGNISLSTHRNTHSSAPLEDLAFTPVLRRSKKQSVLKKLAALGSDVDSTISTMDDERRSIPDLILQELLLGTSFKFSHKVGGFDLFHKIHGMDSRVHPFTS